MISTKEKPLWVVALFSLPGEEYRVWSYLYWRQGDNGCAWPSQKSIAIELGLTVQAVRNITRRLQDKGWLHIECPDQMGRSHGLRYVATQADQGATTVEIPEAERVKEGLPFQQEKGSTAIDPSGTERVNVGLPKGSTKTHLHKGRTLYKNTIQGARDELTHRTRGADIFNEPADMQSQAAKSLANGKYFDRFWAEYPRKVARKKCRAIWQGLKFTPDQAEQVIAAVKRYKGTEQWGKEGGRFIPHPSTFLSQGRWEDEIQTNPEAQRGDPDWDPTPEEAVALLRESGMEVKA